MVLSGFGHEKTKPIKPNLCFTAENAEFAELLNNNVLSYFSAVFANSAVNLKKQSQSPGFARKSEIRSSKPVLVS